MRLQPTIMNLHPDNPITRRALWKGAAAFLATRATTIAMADSPRGSVLTYIGTTSPNSQGIHLFSLNLQTGALKQIKIAASIPNPSWLAIHPNGKHLYAANQIANFNGTSSGSVTAFTINPTNGDLTLMNVVSSRGAGPAHISVDPKGQFVYVANYAGGSFAVLRINPDGSLGNATDVHLDTGSVGPTKAASAPTGSFAISGHDAPHAHMIQPDPAGKFVFGVELGQDRIYCWLLDRSNGKLTPAAVPFVAVPPGDGPRHIAFQPNGRYLYSLQEEGSTLLAYSYDAATGALAQRQMLSTLPSHFAGTNFTSEVRVSADGNFVYAANRLHDTIAIFKVDSAGRLTLASETSTEGDYPCSFTIDSTGKFLLCCNQRSDSVTTFRIQDGGSKLEFTGQYAAVGSPASIVFLA